jgi:hypothetical protein
MTVPNDAAFLITRPASAGSQPVYAVMPEFTLPELGPSAMADEGEEAAGNGSGGGVPPGPPPSMRLQAPPQRQPLGPGLFPAAPHSSPARVSAARG